MAPVNVSRRVEVMGYAPPYPVTLPGQHSGRNTGQGNITPDQVGNDREMLKYVSDGLLFLLRIDPLRRLVCSRV
jgi:hypothetical protein